MYRLALLLMIIALPLAVTATASADTVQTEIVTEHDTVPFDPAIDACRFPIDLRTDGSFKVTSYFDNSGTLVKIILTNFGGPFTQTAINPANGRSTTTQSSTSVTVATFNPDGSIATEKQSGLNWQFVVPGLGTVLHATGHFVFDSSGNVTFEAGPHDFFDQNTAAFCNYLAGS